MQKYFIDDELVEKEEFDSRLESEVSDYVEEMYDEMIDEDYQPYQIGCCTFYASQILSELDPIAYRCGLSDYVSDRLEEAQSELDLYNEYEVNHMTFRIEEEEEEEEE